MEQFSEIDKQIDDALRQEPNYFLPASFADDVADRMFRKIMFKLQVRNYLKIVGISALMFALFFGFRFVAHTFPQYLPQIPQIPYMPVLIGAVIVALFFLFMDKVVLSYLRMRFK